MEAQLTDEVRRYLGSIGGGYRALSPEKRSLLGKLNGPRIWATRRLRYGPTGRKNGATFLKAHKGKLDSAIAWSGEGNPD